MKEKKVLFGLWHKKEKKLLKFSTSSNGTNTLCVDTTIELNTYGDTEWLVDSPVNAEYVRNFSTPWYNAGHTTPMHDFDAHELVVVSVKTEIKEEEIKIPTSRDLFTQKYSETNPRHLKGILEKMDEGIILKYSYYDLLEFLDKKCNKQEADYD